MGKRKRLKVRKADLGFRDYLILGMVFAVIVIVRIVTGIHTFQYRQNQVEITKTIMQKTVDNEATIIDKYFNEYLDKLRMLALFPQIYEMDEKTQEAFLKHRSSMLKFEYLFVVDTKGMGYYFDEGVVRTQKKEQFFQDIMEYDTFITDPYYGTPEEQNVIITACVSIRDENGKKVGVLCGAIDMKELQEILKDSNTIEGNEVYMISSDGYYVSADDMNKVYQKECIFEEENSDFDLIKEAFQRSGHLSGTIQRGGEEFQASIAVLDGYDLAILQCIKTKAILDNSKSVERLQFLLEVLILCLAFCVIRIILRWRKSDERINTDVLTKCYSRAAIEKMMERLEHEHKYGVALMYMDLNKFKYVNDTYGHEKGDELLRIFASVLKQILGKEGIVGRVGGDEFIAIFIDKSAEQLEHLWSEVTRELQKQSKTLDFEYMISSSYGYAIRGKGEEDSLFLLMRKADERMYAYKTSHRMAREK